jgi:putative ABC transport system substrate-binding protein
LRRTSIAHLALLLLWVTVRVAPAAAAMAPQSFPDRLTVISALGEEPATSNFAHLVADIEDAPDVVVLRISLKTDDQDAVLPRFGRPVQLAFNGQSGIAVIYPDIGEPYRSVFSRIIEGIEDRAKTRVAAYAIGANQSAGDLAAELQRQNIHVVIALGRNGVKAVANLDRSVALVVGGVLSAPESEMRAAPIFSLAPDPSLLFERLKALMPGVRRVIVVYDPRQNAWLIRLAREAARNFGVELVAKEAPDLKSAMYLYQEHIANADPKRDVLWLPQDSVTVEESTVLPFVLQEAWSRSLLVFSSSVAHVKRGALFSLYPDSMELGRNMANTALAQISSGQTARSVTPLKDVLMAVNLRTAGHLGLNIGDRRQTFDLVFPEP